MGDIYVNMQFLHNSKNMLTKQDLINMFLRNSVQLHFRMCHISKHYQRSGLEKIMIFFLNKKNWIFLFKSDFFNLN